MQTTINSQFIRRQFLLLLLLVVTVYRSQAQHADIRLSPEPLSYALPADARIQDAGRIGTTVLAVWGTITFAPDRSVINALQLQLLHDTILVGNQARLTSAQARPSKFVKVIPLQDRFLILWNDVRKEAPGVYMQVIDSLGSVLGNEELFSARSIESQSDIFVLNNPSDILLLWNSPSPQAGVFERRINSVGKPFDSELRIADGRVRKVTEMSTMQLVRVIEMESLPGFLLFPDGRIDERAIPNDRFTTSFYLDSDTSIVVLKKNTLSFYRSIFDTAAVRSLQAPIPEISWPAGIVAHDSMGYFVVWFRDSALYNKLFINIYRSAVTIDTSLSNPIRASQLLIDDSWDIGANNISRTWTSIFNNTGCNHSHAVYLSIHTHKTGHGQDSHNDRALAYSIDPDGRISGDDGGFVLPPCGIEQLLIAAARLKSDTFSIIRVSVKEKNGRALWDADLTSPTVPWRPNIPQILPNIFARADSAILTWQEDNRYVRSEWHAITDTVSLPVQTLPRTAGSYCQVINNVTLVTAATSSATEVSARNGGPGYDCKIACDFYAAGADLGWKNIFHFSDGRFLHQVSYPLMAIDYGGFNPNSSELTTAMTNYVQFGRTVLGFDLTGKKTWSIDNPGGYGPYTLIPNDSTSYIGTSGEKCYLWEEKIIRQVVPFANNGLHPVYRRLLGPYFLRLYNPLSDSLKTALDLYGMDGTLQKTVSLDTVPSNNTSFIVQNRIDSSIIILFGSSKGVFLTLLDNQLDIKQNSIRINAATDSTANPAGVIRNDTLFAVWEDYRNGTADIYGTWKVLPRILFPIIDTAHTDTTHSDTTTHPDPPIPPTRQEIIKGIIPNPVLADAQMELELKEASPVQITLFDQLGRSVYHADYGTARAGRVTLQLQLGSLYNGSYTLIVQTKEFFDKQKVVVYH